MTIFELKELIDFVAHRRRILGRSQRLYYFNQAKGADQMAWLRATRLKTIEDLLTLLEKAPDGRAHFEALRAEAEPTKRAHHQRKIAHVDPKKPRCPNCAEPLYFLEWEKHGHPEHHRYQNSFVREPIPRHVRFSALHCVMGHRFCVNCSGRGASGHPDRTCLFCAKTGERVAGHSSPELEYCSGRFVIGAGGNMERLARN